MTENTVTAYLGVGSNLGDRSGYLAYAVHALAYHDLSVTGLSSVYETVPVACDDDVPPFLNAVIEGEWQGTAAQLVHTALTIEKECGRRRSVPNAPRVLDIDVLVCGGEYSDTAEVTVPHPRMHERLFVLAPLCELAATRMHPTRKRTYRDLRDDCRRTTNQRVQLYGPPHMLTATPVLNDKTE